MTLMSTGTGFCSTLAVTTGTPSWDLGADSTFVPEQPASNIAAAARPAVQRCRRGQRPGAAPLLTAPTLRTPRISPAGPDLIAVRFPSILDRQGTRYPLPRRTGTIPKDAA